MRINVYNEEITDDFEYVTKYVTETDKAYYGFRIYLKSHSDLHHTMEDDDRSAITFWFGTRKKALKFLRTACSVAEIWSDTKEGEE